MAALALALHELLDGLYEAVHRQNGFPVRAQWALLISAVAGILNSAVPADHESAAALMDRLCEQDPLFNRVRPRLTWLHKQGKPFAFYTRRVCCFNYTGGSREYCGSCPVIPAEKRLAEALASEDEEA
jgi:hypothetical protein